MIHYLKTAALAAFLFLLTTSTFAKPLVVTTFSILGDMVHEIGQDKIDVKTLVGPDQDSHVFEPRPEDAKELGRADLVVVNGLGFEGWLDRLIEASGFHGKILVATTGIDPLIYTYHGKKVIDPTPGIALKMAKFILIILSRGSVRFYLWMLLFLKRAERRIRRL